MRFFFSDGRRAETTIVVGGIDDGFIWQAEQLAMDRIVEPGWIAGLEISPSTSANQQRIAGKNDVINKVADAGIGVTGSFQNGWNGILRRSPRQFQTMLKIEKDTAIITGWL